MSESKRSRFLRFIGYAIPVLLVVYVLSIGPAIVFHNEILTEQHLEDLGIDPSNADTLQWFESFYTPFGLVMAGIPYSDYILEQYISFCHKVIVGSSDEY